jgi:hypothetical protein
MDTETIRTIALVLLTSTVFILIAVAGLLLLGAMQLRKIKVPPGSGFVQTLHYTPILVVVAIDLLDLVLDILAAPLSWVILDRLGLQGLRGVAAVEAVIPGTQFIPTLTLSWIAVRLFGIGLN